MVQAAPRRELTEMCGIAGIFHHGERRPVAAAPLRAMAAAQRHRGPDAQGLHRSGPLGLAFARLAIIDVAGGDQPLLTADGQVALICNGEIYNHRELRAWLESRGHRFRTRSDCEVILHLYLEEGDRCVERLRGMFAFALADHRRQRLLLGRDRLGKKPLYMASDGKRVAFASELKALVAAGCLDGSVDEEALLLYLTFGYVPAPWSIFQGCRKLPAGHIAVVDHHGLRLRRYWRQPTETEERTPQEWDEELERELAEAVCVRLESEVPLGAFLSGGLDSGLVVATMAATGTTPVRTVTVGFDDPGLDERSDAALTAAVLGTDHREILATPDLTRELPAIAWHLDEPFADPSAVPTWYLCRETRRRVTVALSGDGGDELFAGYTGRYGVHLWENRVRPWIPSVVRSRLLPGLARRWPTSHRLPRPLRLRTVLGNLAVDGTHAYFRDRQVVPAALLDGLLGQDLASRRHGFDPFLAIAPHLATAPSDPLARALYLDQQTWLADDGLVKVDRMSMAHSLEVRCPLLDHRVVELAARMPARLKYAHGRGKLPLRRLAAKHLPAAVLRRAKRGFAPPVASWLRHELHDLARATLLAPSSLSGGLLQSRAVSSLLDDHRSGKVDAGWALWTLLMLDVWWHALGRAASAHGSLVNPADGEHLQEESLAAGA